MRDVGRDSWDADRDLWQEILNARPIPPRHLQRLDREPIRVIVRLVWGRDGTEDVETLARDWVGRSVLVDVDDRRWRARAVWVDAADVRRA